MNRPSLLVVLVVLLAFLFALQIIIAHSSSLSETTFYIDPQSGDDSGDCGETVNTPCKTLKHALKLATDNEAESVQLLLAAGEFSGADHCSNIVIQTAASILPANLSNPQRPVFSCGNDSSQDPVFTISPSSGKMVSFQGIEFSDKKYFALAINSSDTSMSIEDCHFHNNMASVVVSAAADVSISNCTFKGNDFAVYIFKCPMIRVSISDSTFTYNNYSVILSGPRESVVSVNSCQFANHNGGYGLIIENSGESAIDITSSEFHDLSLGIYILKSQKINVSISACQFSHLRSGAIQVSEASILIVNSSQFEGNVGEYGAAIGASYIQYLKIQNTNFTSNQAISSYIAIGGAVAFVNVKETLIESSRFENNSVINAQFDGTSLGGALFGYVLENLTLKNVTFIANKANGGIGGAAMISDVLGSCVFLDTTFLDNSASIVDALMIKETRKVDLNLTVFTSTFISETELVLLTSCADVQMSSSQLGPVQHADRGSVPTHLLVAIDSTVQLSHLACNSSKSHACVLGENSKIFENSHFTNPFMIQPPNDFIAENTKKSVNIFPISVFGYTTTKYSIASESTGKAFVRSVPVTDPYLCSSIPKCDVVIMAWDNMLQISFRFEEKLQAPLSIRLSSTNIQGPISVTALTSPLIFRTVKAYNMLVIIAGVSSDEQLGILIVQCQMENNKIRSVAENYWMAPDFSDFGAVLHATYNYEGNSILICTYSDRHIFSISVSTQDGRTTVSSYAVERPISGLRFLDNTTIVSTECHNSLPGMSLFSLSDGQISELQHAVFSPVNNSEVYRCKSTVNSPFTMDFQKITGEGSNSAVIPVIVGDPNEEVVYLIDNLMTVFSGCSGQKNSCNIIARQRRLSDDFAGRSFGDAVLFHSKTDPTDGRIIVALRDGFVAYSNMSAETPYFKIPNRYVPTIEGLRHLSIGRFHQQGITVFTPEFARRNSMQLFFFPMTQRPGVMAIVQNDGDGLPTVDFWNCPSGTFSNVTNDYSFCSACPIGSYQQNSNSSSCIPCLTDWLCPLGATEPLDRGSSFLMVDEGGGGCFRETAEEMSFESFIISAMFNPTSWSFLVSALFVGTGVGSVLMVITILHFPRLRSIHIITRARQIFMSALDKINFVGRSDDISAIALQIRHYERRRKRKRELSPQSSVSPTSSTNAEESDHDSAGDTAKSYNRDIFGSLLSLAFVLSMAIFGVYTLVFLFSCHCPDGCPEGLSRACGVLFSRQTVCPNTRNTASIQMPNNYGDLITELSSLPIVIDVTLEGVPMDNNLCQVSQISIEPCSTDDSLCKNQHFEVSTAEKWCRFKTTVSPMLAGNDFWITISFAPSLWIPNQLLIRISFDGSGFQFEGKIDGIHYNFNFDSRETQEAIKLSSNDTQGILYGTITQQYQRSFIVHKMVSAWPWHDSEVKTGVLLNSIFNNEIKSTKTIADFEFNENLNTTLVFWFITSRNIEIRTSAPYVKYSDVFTVVLVATFSLFKLFGTLHTGISKFFFVGRKAHSTVGSLKTRVAQYRRRKNPRSDSKDTNIGMDVEMSPTSLPFPPPAAKL